MYTVKSEMKKLLHMAHTFNQTDTFIIDYLGIYLSTPKSYALMSKLGMVPI